MWVRSAGGPSADKGLLILVDASENVYITGYFDGTADFDPGLATFNLTSAGSWDVYVSKLDAAGNWPMRATNTRSVT